MFSEIVGDGDGVVGCSDEGVNKAQMVYWDQIAKIFEKACKVKWVTLLRIRVLKCIRIV